MQNVINIQNRFILEERLIMKFLCRRIFVVLLFLLLVQLASAHEAYVLNQTFFWDEMQASDNSSVFDALKSPHNRQVTVFVTAGILLFLVANFMFRKTKLGAKVNNSAEKYSYLSPIILRLVIAVSFFFSAYHMDFLGPELHLSQVPYGHAMQVALFAISIMIAFGFLTELAALAGIILFTCALMFFGTYILTYMHYLGELIVLLLFGMRKWSVDEKLFGPLKRLQAWKKHEVVIVRVFYGLALIYAAITVKFLHPVLTSTVATEYHLTSFTWLFPSDPLLVALGAGLAEIMIGIFIAIGFELRAIVVVSLFYLTLSLFYFQELLWPHLLMYGIAIILLLQPEDFTLDHLLFDKKK
jgi:uncharacterized membrane protein YphA (DoxX/SURF4 family)